MPTKGYDTAPSTVREALTDAARQTGVAEDLLISIVGRESRFNPYAANPKSTAQGLGQHLDSTWQEITKSAGKRYGITAETSRFDPRASALMTAELAKSNAASLKRALGRDAAPGELYAAHFLGAGGAAEMIKAATKNPTAAAADLFADAAASNRSIFYDDKGGKRSMRDVLKGLTDTVGGAPGVATQGFSAKNIYEVPTDPSAPPPPPKRGWMEDTWDNFTKAAEQEQSQVLVTQFLMRQGDASLAPDANFRWTPELVKEKTAELPQEMAEWVVENAHSEAHIDSLVKRAQRSAQNEEDLNALGFAENLGLRGAALLTDIPTWFLGAGAAKVAGGAKLGRLALAGRAGLIAMAENVPVEGLKAALRPDYGIDDALLGTATSFAFGAGFGALGKSGKDLDNAFQAEAAGAEKHVMQKNGTLTPEGEAYYAAMGVPGPQVPRKGTSGGAAASPLPDGPDGIGKARFSVMGGLKKSPSYEVRDLADRLDNDVVGDGGSSIRGGETAFEYMRRVGEAGEAFVARQHEDAWEDYAKRNGIVGAKKIGHARDQFGRDVGRQILNPDHSTDPAVIKAAGAHSELFNTLLQRAKAEGAEWAQEVEPNPHYMPMVFHKENIRRALEAHGEDGVVSVVAKAFKAANPKMADDLAQRVAAKYFRTVQHAVEGWGGARTNALSGLDTDELLDLMIQQGLKQEDAEAFIAANKGTAVKGGPKNFRKKAVLADLTKFLPEGGEPGSEFSIRDLTELNAEKVSRQYNRTISGHVAMVRAGFKTFGDFEKSVEAATVKAANGLNGMTDTVARKNQSALMYLGKQVYGIPVIDTNDVRAVQRARFASILGNYNFSTMMGQSGIAQFGDIPKIMLKTSMEASFRAFKMGDVFGVLAKGGKGADELGRDLEVMTGVGTNRARNSVVAHFEDIEDCYQDEGAATALERAQRLGKSAANVTAMVSGMTPVTDFLGRWAVRSHMQHLADVVTGAKKVDKKVLYDMGLGPQEIARFKTLVEKMDLAPNGVVRGMNRAKLMETDPTGYDLLAGYLSRQARTTVLETSPGMLPQLMGDPMMRLFLQFRSFSMASHEANTLHNLKMGNAYAAKSFLVSGAWATAVYATHTYTKSIGRPDAEEYREKALNPATVVTNGFLTRSADSGIIASVIGTGWDFTLAPAGVDNPLNQGRTTGLESGLKGIPTVATGLAVGTALQQAVKDTFTDSRMTQADVARWQRLVPLNNTYGVANALKAFTGLFPEEEN